LGQSIHQSIVKAVSDIGANISDECTKGIVHIERRLEVSVREAENQLHQYRIQGFWTPVKWMGITVLTLTLIGTIALKVLIPHAIVDRAQAHSDAVYGKYYHDAIANLSPDAKLRVDDILAKGK
jgi:hypothetical protein